MNAKTVISIFLVVLTCAAECQADDIGGRVVPQDFVASQKNKLHEKNNQGVSGEYIIEEPNLKQTLIVRSVSENRIDFTLTLDVPCKRTVVGTAIASEGDYEEDDDENGVAYGAKQFVYKGKNGLTLWIRIDNEHYVHAKLNVLDKSGRCQFSEDLMKRAR